MTGIFEIKANIMSFYKKFDKIINLGAKFLVCLLAIINLNTFFGHSSLFANMGVNIGIALIATILPVNWYVLALMVVTELQVFEVSMEGAIIILAIMAVAYLLFGRLIPKYSIFIILMPLAYKFNIAFLIPLVAGLFLEGSSIIPINCGVMVYYFSKHIENILGTVGNSNILDSSNNVVSTYTYIINNVVKDAGMITTIVAFTVVVILMTYLRKLTMDNIWYITIGIGTGALTVILIIVGTVLKSGFNIVGILLGAVICGFITAFIQFFRFNLDYKKSEKVQFEDDYYYYYVKMIPKIKRETKEKLTEAKTKTIVEPEIKAIAEEVKISKKPKTVTPKIDISGFKNAKARQQQETIEIISKDK